jgi:1,4-dihydroxy-2-naphthoyl-CoA synthase
VVGGSVGRSRCRTGYLGKAMEGMMQQPTVKYSARGAVAVVTIDRPEVRNAIDQPTRQALADAFRRFDAEAEHSVAVWLVPAMRFARVPT